MLSKKSLKRALIFSVALIGGNLLIPSSTFAASCSSTISGTTFSGIICSFDTGNDITISSGAELGGINQSSYPASGAITNNGTINNGADTGIYTFDSSLDGGINNGGTISSTDSSAIYSDSSNISNGITNSGTIRSENGVGLYLNNSSTLSGDITNSGSIISNSVNDPALIIRNDSVINGNIINSGTMRAYGDGNGLHMSFNSTINGSITNSGTIRGGYSGLYLSDSLTFNGNISNSGTITGDNENGISIRNAATINGDITNSGTISASNYGVFLSSNSTINKLTNQADATISGDSDAINIDDSSIITNGIHNYGTITGSINAIYVSLDSTVSSINIYDGSTITGAINAEGTDININGGTINGTISANSVNIESAATFLMEHTITAQDSVTNAGTLSLGTATRTINAANGYAQLVGGTLKIDVQDAATYGQLSVDNNVDLSQSGKIDVNVLSGANIVIGDTFSNIISGSTLTSPTDGFSVTDNRRLLNFSATTNSSSGVDLTVIDDASTSVSQSNSVAGNSGNAGVAAKLDEIINANLSGDWQNIIGALNSLSSDQQIANAVSQMTPAFVGATNAASIEAMGSTLRIVQARQASYSGFAAGEDYRTSHNLWIKTFGSWGNQDNKSGVSGYDATTYGFITGTDKDIDDKTRLGVGVSYFNSKLKSNGGNNQANIDSFLGVFYGNYSLANKTDINAQIAAGYNDNHAKRDINFASINRIAKSNYDSWSLSAGAGLSHLVNVSNATVIVPQIRLDYFNAGNESYSESGAGALNLQVASQAQNQLIPAAEVKANHKFTSKISLALNTGLGYDLLHNQNSVSTSFIGSGAFVTYGLKPSPWIIRSDISLIWKQSDAFELTTRYDRRDRGRSYTNQTISLNSRILF